MKKFILVLLSIIAVITAQLSEGTYTSASALSVSSPVYLKAGKYFILYTKPAAPFVDSNNRLLVPLRSFEDLFGGKVFYSPSAKTAQLHWLDHEFTFEIGSTQAIMDGNTINMDTTPALKGGAMFLPVRIFLDQTDVKNHWDNALQVLVLGDERILVGQPFLDFVGNDIVSDNKDNGAIRIKGYSIAKKAGTYQLTIHATNISGQTIPAGKADIHPLVNYGGALGGMSTDAYSRPIYPPIPEIKKDNDVDITQKFGDGEIDYIITVARLFS